LNLVFFNQLNDILAKEDKKYLAYLFLLTIIVAGIETLGISIIMPFLSVANDFSLINSNNYYRYFYIFFDFSNEKYFVVSFGVAILIFYFLRLAINSIYVYLVTNFIYSRYNLIANRLFKVYLSLPYKNYTKQNSSSLTKVIVNETANITNLFWFVSLLISELFIFMLIYLVLMYINYKITLSISVILVFMGIFVKIFISKKMKYFGSEREKYQKTFYEILNRSFNNVKMLKLYTTKETINNFASVSKKFTDMQAISTFLQLVPRFLFEYFGFSLVIAIVLYYLLNLDTINDLFAVISVFILGLYRLLPSVTRIFSAYNTILFNYKSLEIIYKDLNSNIEILGEEKIIFNDTIKLDNISFSYFENEINIINELNLTISKYDRIAFIGESGSGKSTLVDIIMGLHQVTDGEIYIDNKKLSTINLNCWRGYFGYIPQSVYLFDGTIADNVAFSKDVDKEKVIDVLKKANIWDFLKEKDGLNTKVGESGVMLSGGQKQRIAIARALYTNPEILVLDEATSALDDDTEAKIMDEIYEISKDKTLIIIAHRLSTIKRCNKVYKMENGKIKNV